MMQLLSTLLLLLTTAPMLHPQILAPLVDRNRVLLLFAPSDNDPRIQSQLKLLAHHTAEMKDRDVVLIPVVTENGPPVAADTLRELQPPPVSDNEQLLLRRQYHISPGAFALILIGKDGEEKFRSSTPVTIERLNQIIDAMPMRQDEMKRKPPR